MNLTNFESYIERAVYVRGHEYYESRCVTSVKEIEADEFVAKVEGTETYTVDVELDESLNIVDTFCDCPYDMGEFCKHQVAVFLTLRDVKCGSSKEGEACGHHIPVKSHTKHLSEILSSRTKEELIRFLTEIASDNIEIRERIILEFDDRGDEERISQAISLIQTYIDNHSDDYGYVDYRSTHDAVYGAELVLEKVAEAIAEGNVIHAVKLALCVISEMVDLVQYGDDSGGVIGGVIEDGFEVIDDIVANEELSDLEKREIFDSLIEEVSNSKYDDWSDWRLNFLRNASIFSDIPDLRSKLEIQMDLLLKDEKDDPWGGRYFVERVNQIRYHILLQNEGEETARAFMEQNIRFPLFREMAIKRAMRNKDYEQVIHITLDGEDKDRKMAGLVKDWKEYRYEAYTLSGKLDEQRDLAMEFILDRRFDYYKKLKSTYKTDEWSKVYPSILHRLEKAENGFSPFKASILIEEGEKERLLELVKQRLSSIETYYEHLIPEYREEVYKLFVSYIEQEASQANNRKAYQGVCAIIHELFKAGGKDQALAVREKLLKLYLRKPAFRDELQKIDRIR